MAVARAVKIGIGAVIALVAVLIGLAALLVLAMTNPRFATPVVRWAIATGSGAETALDSARFRLAWPLGFELRGLEIAGDDAPTRMSAIDGRLNPLGFLPRVAFLPEVAASEGDLAARLGGDSNGGPPGWLTEIGRVEAEAIRITVTREGREPELFVIDRASGDLPNRQLDMVGRGGGATVFFDGGLGGPLLNRIEGAVTLRGDNLAEFADLLGLAAPDTPPYEWNANLSSGANSWLLSGITGTVGESDLAGDIEVRLGGERPFIDADLVSRSLDFEDLGLLVGAPTPIEEGEPVNELQLRTNEAFAQSDRLIPNAELDLSRVRAVDADVNFRADNVNAGGFPMEGVEIAMILEDGVMRFDPLAFIVAQGALRSVIEIDASGETVLTDAQGEIDGVILDQMANGNIVRGELEGQFAFTTAGDNLQTAAAGMDGAFSFWVLNGSLRAVMEEAADLDVLSALLILIGEDAEDPDMRDLRCGVVRFEVDSGVARADPIVFDSDDNVIAVEGSVDLSNEALALDVDADNKTFSWGQLFGDVTVRGTLRNPQVSPPIGEAIAQGGLAALLSTLASPLAALPFFNIPSGEDQPCGELMARAQAAPGANQAAPGADAAPPAEAADIPQDAG